MFREEIDIEISELEDIVVTDGARFSPAGQPRVGLFEDVSCLLFVTFCGTDGAIRQPRTMLEWFFAFASVAHDISDPSLPLSSIPASPPEIVQQFRMGFNGCGVDYGCRGILFGRGLEIQVDLVLHRLLELADRYKTTNNLINTNNTDPPKILLCAIGLSRGAVACALLARRLQQHLDAHPDSLSLRSRMLLFDPVPGNFVWSAKLDSPFGFTLASQSLDLRNCAHLTHVCALYPHQPLPAVAAHAPLLLQYPETAAVLEDAVLGCHQGALAPWVALDCQMSFCYLHAFLLTSGVILSASVRTFQEQLQIEPRMLCIALDQILVDRSAPTWRHAHQHGWARTGSVQRGRRSASYLNKLHENIVRHLLEQGGMQRSLSLISKQIEEGGKDFDLPFLLPSFFDLPRETSLDPSFVDHSNVDASTLEVKHPYVSPFDRNQTHSQYLLNIYRSDGFSWVHLTIVICIPILFLSWFIF